MKSEKKSLGVEKMSLVDSPKYYIWDDRENLSPISPIDPWDLQQEERFYNKPVKQIYKVKSPKLPSVKEKTQPSNKWKYETPKKLELSPLDDKLLTGPKSKIFLQTYKHADKFKTPKPKATPRVKKTPKVLKTPKLATPTPKKKPQSMVKDFKSFLRSKGVTPVGVEVIDLVNQGKVLSDFLSSNSAVCPLIKNGEIYIGKFIAEGSYGKVSDIIFKGDSKKYVVKESKGLGIPRKCATDIERVKRNDNRGYTEVPKGSLICQETISEYYISVLASQLIKDMKSINFVDTFFFGMCYGGGKAPKQYTFMEKIQGGPLSSFLKRPGIKVEDVESLYIQILHAIAVYQNAYGLVHSDLHMGNVFIDFLTEDNIDYLQYKIGGKSIFTPAKYIAKIGDWGMGVKYKGKIVGNRKVVENHYINNGVPAMPNFYNTSYDASFITFLFAIFLQNQSPLITSIYKWILNGNLPEEVYKTKGSFVGRPHVLVLTTKLGHVDPVTILENDDLMKHYKFEPKGNGILAGNL